MHCEMNECNNEKKSKESVWWVGVSVFVCLGVILNLMVCVCTDEIRKIKRK